ncbi:MAG: hypothetical protein HYS59_02175 [Candidatus Vogelbacteria bacterium]|nr:hypothetical protein [Candidatus Vogelbacteria bacterium]
MNLARHYVTVAILLVSIAGPWWFAIALVLVATILFESYVEGLLLSLLFDVWYGLPAGVYGTFPLLYFSALTVMTYIVFAVLKTHLSLLRW